MILVNVLHLLIWEDNATLEGLSHQQILAQSTTAFTEHLVWEHGDDSSEGQNEAVDVFHV